MNGARIRLDSYNDDLLINHYNIQSLEFYTTIKVTRGDCDNYFEHMGFKRDRQRFDKNDLNEELDDRLLKQNLSFWNE